MTTLGSIIEEQGFTYSSVAERAQLQARTVRAIAMGTTPIDKVSVGTVRRIAAALSVPMAVILEDGDPVYPGDAALARTDRLSAAIRDVMWPRDDRRYPSPVETDERDQVADLTPDQFFDSMPPIDARRG